MIRIDFCFFCRNGTSLTIILSHSSKITWSTESEAFLKSIKIPAAKSPLSRSVWVFSVIERRVLLVLRLRVISVVSRKSNWFQKLIKSSVHYFLNNFTDTWQERNSSIIITKKLWFSFKNWYHICSFAYVAKATSCEGFVDEFREGDWDFLFD